MLAAGSFQVDLRARLFGGSHLLAGLSRTVPAGDGLGARNVEVARSLLAAALTARANLLRMGEIDPHPLHFGGGEVEGHGIALGRDLFKFVAGFIDQVGGNGVARTMKFGLGGDATAFDEPGDHGVGAVGRGP